MPTSLRNFEQDSVLATRVHSIVDTTLAIDMHTHLFAPEFGAQLNLWGVDELLTYHYLVAEVFRYLDMPFEKFWRLPKAQQAELIWEQLFIKNSPMTAASYVCPSV